MRQCQLIGNAEPKKVDPEKLIISLPIKGVPTELEIEDSAVEKLLANNFEGMKASRFIKKTELNQKLLSCLPKTSTTRKGQSELASSSNACFTDQSFSDNDRCKSYAVLNANALDMLAKAASQHLGLDAADLPVLAKYGSVQWICKNCESQPCNVIQHDQFKLLIQKLDALVDQRKCNNAKLWKCRNQIKDMTPTIQALKAQIDTKPKLRRKRRTMPLALLKPQQKQDWLINK